MLQRGGKEKDIGYFSATQSYLFFGKDGPPRNEAVERLKPGELNEWKEEIGYTCARYL